MTIAKLLSPFAFVAGATLSLIFWLWLLGLGVFFGTLNAILMFPVSRIAPRRKLLHAVSLAWGTLTLLPFQMFGVLRVKVTGREHVPDQPCVIVANHLSQLDILITFLTWIDFKWVSKASIFKIPFIGWGMAACGYIGLKRGDSASVKQMMKDCKTAIDGGSRVILFPEGTRSKDGRLQSFKPGPFVIASRSKVPLLPLVILGTDKALPKHGWRFRWGTRMELRFLPPFSAEEVSELGSKALMIACEERFREALGEKQADQAEAE